MSFRWCINASKLFISNFFSTSISYASCDVSRYANKWGKLEDYIGHIKHLYDIVKLDHELVDVTEVGKDYVWLHIPGNNFTFVFVYA